MAFTAQTEVTPLPADTLAADTLQQAAFSDAGTRLCYGLAFERDMAGAEPVGARSNGMSWLLTGLLLVFMVACLRYRKNSRYFSLMLNDVMELRERHNAFDDTLRETSFVWILNLIWCASVGFLLYGLLCRPESGVILGGIDVKRLFICMGMAGAYTLFLTLAYAVVGNLFSDTGLASVWVKGYLSTQALEAVGMFPLALLGLCVPGLLGGMIVLGIIIFLIAKVLFIYKSFCIFFTETVSWVLFLYYLCSLEIVPVVLAYAGAAYFCGDA